MVNTPPPHGIAFPHLTPTTAIGWLKAIGLLRISEAPGYWRDDCFYLEIDSAETLVEKLLNDYQPKPFASPWNSKTIFNAPDKLQQILNAPSDRYALVREGYAEIQSGLQALDLEGLGSDKKKIVIMQDLVPQVYEAGHWQEWIRAVGVLTTTQKKLRFLCNDLLGTGGNSGQTEFCTEYLSICQAHWDLETGDPLPGTEALIRAAVLGESLPQTLVKQALLGHTYPVADYFDDLAPSGSSAKDDFDDLAPSGSSSADYMGNGGGSTQLANPIDLILYLEGATTFSGTQRALNEVTNEGEQELTIAAYPLLLEVNSGSADTSDRTGRSYEVWLPLWSEPRDWQDFQDVVTTDLSFRLKHQVSDTLDLLRLMSEVQYPGFDRYSRFGLWKRKGQGDYLIHVGLAVPGRSDFAADLRAWSHRACPTDKQSHGQYNLLTAVQKSLYRLQQGNREAMNTIRLLGRLEQLHSRIQPKIPPVPQLPEQWVQEVYQDCPIAEVELAIALASAMPRNVLSSARYSPNKNTWFWSDQHQDRLKISSLEMLCLSLLQLWNKQDKKDHPSQRWTYWASPDAIAAFIAGSTHDEQILELTLGFVLCNLFQLPCKLAPPGARQPLPEPYKYAASLQWNQQTTLTTQTITALTAGSTVSLGRQLAALQHPVVLPESIASGKRCALALAFPCKPFYSLGDSHA